MPLNHFESEHPDIIQLQYEESNTNHDSVSTEEINQEQEISKYQSYISQSQNLIQEELLNLQQKFQAEIQLENREIQNEQLEQYGNSELKNQSLNNSIIINEDELTNESQQQQDNNNNQLQQQIGSFLEYSDNDVNYENQIENNNKILEANKKLIEQRIIKMKRNIQFINFDSQDSTYIRDVEIQVIENGKQEVNFLNLLKTVIERQVQMYFFLEDEIKFYVFDSQNEYFVHQPFSKGEISMLENNYWENTNEIKIRYKIINSNKNNQFDKQKEYELLQEERSRKEKEKLMQKQVEENLIIEEFLDSLFKKKTIKREKERSIQFAIENVQKWRSLQKTGIQHKGVQINLNLNQAAQLIEVRRKTLDEYHKQIKEGQKNGFQFDKYKDQKIGVLRKYNKNHKQQQEQEIYELAFPQIKIENSIEYENYEQIQNTKQLPFDQLSTMTNYTTQTPLNQQQQQQFNQQQNICDQFMDTTMFQQMSDPVQNDFGNFMSNNNLTFEQQECQYGIEKDLYFYDQQEDINCYFK